MIDNPLDELPWFIDAGADLLNVHVEALDEADLARALAQIHEAGLLAAAAIKPTTPVSALSPVIAELDMALVMSVEPGFSGQSYIAGSDLKVAEVVQMARAAGNEELLIQVDGGIGLSTAPLVAAAGADVLVCGNAVFKADDQLAADVAMDGARADAEDAVLAEPAADFIYLDYAATAPLCAEAAGAMAPFQVPGPANLAVNANANALYGVGRAAFDLLESARRRAVCGNAVFKADDPQAAIGAVKGAADEAREAALARGQWD